MMGCVRGPRLPLVLTACLAVTACGKAPEKRAEVVTGSAAIVATPPAVGPVHMSFAAPGTPSQVPSQRKYVAVSHSYTLSLPVDAVEAAQRHHLELCASLGCEILESRLNRGGPRWVNAHTTLRLPPSAFATFAAGLAAPPAEITSHSEVSEDKTTVVLDLDKRLETKAALRDRLTTLLRETPSKNVGDLLNLEREIAQIQGDIESTTAQREYLRSQTDMVKVDIQYEGVGADAAQPAGVNWQPLKAAAKEFIDILVESLANVMTFTARVLPWTPVVVLAGWLLRLVWRRWRRKAA
ncbi:DUF4349 domain-containing protein [Nitrospirillum sp. BR 11164]|uniref:DUF4349 domain-containing protein n=1 Tax=Nitrospirillum sp. BR 11164 TaxID=3104324 RepID=UPI002AFDDEC1|nr:DUF4349 domain-containing protein [Nitrospirillum sp. BR 11164]MEA1651714.1 DUF4349 domain-containing protein [Nitrospirillum sp. BR 11164]